VTNEGQYSPEKGYKMDRNQGETLVQHFVLGERQQIAKDFKDSLQPKFGREPSSFLNLPSHKKLGI